MSLRRRIEQSELLIGLLGRMVAGWVRLCDATTRWDRRGRDELRTALERGPVVLILWHECAAFGMKHWPADWRPLTSLTDSSPAGRVSGAVQARLGLRPVVMDARGSNRAASREVMRRMAEGVCIGLTGDGPTGPARVLKDAGLDWARATGAPVFLYAFATRRQWRLRSWDRMIWPRPFTRGVSLYRRFEGEVPRRADSGTLARLRADVAAALTALTDEAERRANGR